MHRGCSPAPSSYAGRGWSVWSGERWLEHRFRQAENPIISPEIVVRTSLQKRVGGYDPQLPKAGDMEMYMRLAANADVGFLRGADQAYYRVHGQNMSATVSALMDLRQRRSVFEFVLERYGDRLSDTRRLSDMVNRQLSREALWAAARVYDREPLWQSRLAQRFLGAEPNQEEHDADELADFAVECWPEVKRLPLYQALESRRRIGARGMAYMFNQKGRWWLRRRSWKYRGF